MGCLPTVLVLLVMRRNWRKVVSIGHRWGDVRDHSRIMAWHYSSIGPIKGAIGSKAVDGVLRAVICIKLRASLEAIVVVVAMLLVALLLAASRT